MKKKDVDTIISKYMAAIGKKGGEKSKRKLTKKQAKEMVRIREEKRRNKLT